MRLCSDRYGRSTARKGQSDGRTGENETGFAKTKRECPSSFMACNRWFHRNERFGAGQVFHEKFGHGFGRHKLDGTCEGWGTCLIFRELELPIYFIGLGESPEDLQPFSIDYYLDSIFPPTVVETSG